MSTSYVTLKQLHKERLQMLLSIIAFGHPAKMLVGTLTDKNHVAGPPKQGKLH